jgi:copper transport protein
MFPILPIRAGFVRVALLALAGVLACVAPAAAHTSLRHSAPADGDTVPVGTGELRLLFSGPVDARLTTLTLTRGGVAVELPALTTGEPADRAFLVNVPGGLAPGTYTATWRTVAADGHPITGSFRFVVAGDDSDADAPPMPDASAAAEDDAMAGAAAPPAGPSLAGPLAVAIRWAGFLSLLGMIGTVGFRFGVLGRVPQTPELRPVVDMAAYGTWYVALAAAALSALTLPGQLWVQSAVLSGPEEALDPERLRLLLAGTPWGLAWLLQAMATVAFVVGLMVVRAPHGRTVGWVGAGVGTLLLAAAPALTGHTIAIERWVEVAILSDFLHVLGAGLWLGTLGVLLAAGLPATAYAVTAHRGEAVAAMVRAFSPVALVSAGVVMVTGLVNALLLVDAPSSLWTTAYGRTLLLKLALLAGVAALGFHHWRRVQPRLGGEGSARALAPSAGAEVALGALIVLVTAVLVVLPPP